MLVKQKIPKTTIKLRNIHPPTKIFVGFSLLYAMES